MCWVQIAYLDFPSIQVLLSVLDVKAFAEMVSSRTMFSSFLWAEADAKRTSAGVEENFRVSLSWEMGPNCLRSNESETLGALLFWFFLNLGYKFVALSRMPIGRWTWRYLCGNLARAPGGKVTYRLIHGPSPKVSWQVFELTLNPNGGFIADGTQIIGDAPFWAGALAAAALSAIRAASRRHLQEHTRLQDLKWGTCP